VLISRELSKPRNRSVLAAFNSKVLPALGGKPSSHVMLIDSNDERGIDFGLMSRDGSPLGMMRIEGARMANFCKNRRSDQRRRIS
jgi:hypothetical protein